MVTRLMDALRLYLETWRKQLIGLFLECSKSLRLQETLQSLKQLALKMKSLLNKSQM